LPKGLSAPVVWGDRIFLTGLASNQLLTLAFSTDDGRELWRRVAPAEKIEACHSFSSPAASTPCTDGERVYAYFGSFGLLAYDFAGKEIWRHDGCEELIVQGKGRVAAYRLEGGEPTWWVKGWGFTAVTTPVAADGRIYAVNEPGTFAVLRAGDTLEVLAVNKLGESVRATPALVGERIYVRSAAHLWAFSAEASAEECRVNP